MTSEYLNISETTIIDDSAESYQYVEQLYAWNHLPSNIKLLTSLHSFKVAIKHVDMSAFLKCSFFK